MRSTGRWLALLAVVIGAAAAVANAGDSPLAPKNLAIESLGAGAAVQTNDGKWTPVTEGFEWQGLTLLGPNLVRGPARVRVVAGTYIEIQPGGIARLSWEPAVRGWRFVAAKGDLLAVFAHMTVWIREGDAVTLTGAGELYRAPSGYSPSGSIGLTGLPEVSGFRPFEDDHQ